LSALNDGYEFIERAFRFLRVLLFEFRQPLDLQLLFPPRRAREFHFRNVIAAVAVTIESDNRPHTFINLLLVTMRRVLNLAALISIFHRGEDATEPFDFTEFIENRGFDRALDRFHSG